MKQAISQGNTIMLQHENRMLRQMNRNLVYTARAIHRENVMLKMKTGLLLMLPAPEAKQ